jgi:hypothetical protein
MNDTQPSAEDLAILEQLLVAIGGVDTAVAASS